MKKLLLIYIISLVLVLVLRSIIKNADNVIVNNHYLSTNDYISTEQLSTDYINFSTKSFEQPHYGYDNGELILTTHYYKEFLLSETIDYAGDVDYYKVKLSDSKLLKFDLIDNEVSVRLLNSSFEPVSYEYTDGDAKIFGLGKDLDYFIEIKHEDNTVSTASYNILITDLIHELSEKVISGVTYLIPNYKQITYEFKDVDSWVSDFGQLFSGEIRDVYFDDFPTAGRFMYNFHDNIKNNIFTDKHAIYFYFHKIAFQNYDGKVHIRIYKSTEYLWDKQLNTAVVTENIKYEVTEWDGVIIDYPFFTLEDGGYPYYTNFKHDNLMFLEYYN